MTTESAATVVKTRQTDKHAKQGIDRYGGKFLTFFLDKEEYGIEILKVHEIIGMMNITSVPRTPAFVKGVTNLRGKIIPVINLRLKFGMEPLEQNEQMCIIVVQVQGTQMGIVVDQVSEVSNIADDDIEPVPSFGADIRTDYILGIGKSEGRVRLLLDIDKVLSTKEIIEIQSASLTEMKDAEPDESRKSSEKKGGSNKSTKERRKDHVKES